MGLSARSSNSKRWRNLYRGRAAVKREFGPLEKELPFVNPPSAGDSSTKEAPSLPVGRAQASQRALSVRALGNMSKGRATGP
jgi:hypothetical protein